MNVTLASGDAAVIWIVGIAATIFAIWTVAHAWADRAKYHHRAANYRAEADLLRAKREVMGRDLTEYEADA